MAKCKRGLEEDEVEGCLHGLSSILLVTFVGKLQKDTDISKNGYFGQTKHLSFHEATAAKTPIKISNIRKVQSREDSSNVNVLVNAVSVKCSKNSNVSIPCG